MGSLQRIIHIVILLYTLFLYVYIHRLLIDSSNNSSQILNALYPYLVPSKPYGSLFSLFFTNFISCILCAAFVFCCCSRVLVCKYIQQRQCLGYAKFKSEFRAVVVVKNWPERVLFEWLTNFPSKNSNLSWKA